MNPTANPTNDPAAFPEDELSQFELDVARRADQLAKIHGSGQSRDLEFWLQAEGEMLKARGSPTSALACG